MLLLSKSINRMRYLEIVFFILLALIPDTFGQDNDETDTQSGELSLRIKNINFFKNNEYFNPISASKFVLISSIPQFVDKSVWIEGYTLPGFFLQPELIYSPSGKVTFRGGIHLLKYYGTNKFSQIKPVISTTFYLSERTSLTVGSLSGSDSHRMLDPHFDRERLYSNYAEEGFQLTSINDHLFSDTWLSWENFIIKGDRTREIFTFGESFRYTSSTFADKFWFEVPVQLQFKHFGGQISNYPEYVETYFNLSAGLRINFNLAQQRFGQAGIEYLRFLNDVFPARPSASISKGNASWLRFHYTYKAIYIGAAYWKAHNFYSPNGNPIYSSTINIYSKYVLEERRVITNFFYLNLLPERYLKLFLGLETYYDVCAKRMDNAITLHLNLDKLIKLAILKP